MRKVYLDFIKDRLTKRDFRWLFSRGMQYVLTHASFLVRRPLCGPILGTLVTNYTCNFKCGMCDLRLRDRELREKGLRELDTAAMKQILRDFARLGTPGIGFTGGEPLLRKDIFELLAYAKALGMITHLNTNGYFLDDKAVDNILKAGVDSLNISLDGARSATHDAIRGFSGAFDRAIDAIGRICAARDKAGAHLRIKTVAVINEENVDEVEDMVTLAEELKVDCIEFIPRQAFSGNRSKSDAADPVFLGKTDKMRDYLLGLDAGRIRIENSPAHLKLFNRSFRNMESPLKCFAGYNSLAIDCYGEIYPCVPWYNWRRAVGNINKTDLVAFWHSAEYQQIRKEIAGCRKCYLNCQAELNILFNSFTR